MTEKGPARHGSTSILSPSWKLRMGSWQVAVSGCGPWAVPLMIRPQLPQMLPAVAAERDALLAGQGGELFVG